jgi:2-polyprenyl-3-methyl-5-hydroxy-6-metoxy-1,4-benzoquinol methylase
MQTATYTPGYSAPVLSFMERRTADTHAGFFLPQLMPGWSVLDAGCGPGTITLGLARKVAPGVVTGIDLEDSQFAKSSEQARREGLAVEFRKASVYDLPFREHCFDAVFSHALLEHLAEPNCWACRVPACLETGRADRSTIGRYGRHSHRLGVTGSGPRASDIPSKPGRRIPETSRLVASWGDCCEKPGSR